MARPLALTFLCDFSFDLIFLTASETQGSRNVFFVFQSLVQIAEDCPFLIHLEGIEALLRTCNVFDLVLTQFLTASKHYKRF